MYLLFPNRSLWGLIRVAFIVIFILKF